MERKLSEKCEEMKEVIAAHEAEVETLNVMLQEKCTDYEERIKSLEKDIFERELVIETKDMEMEKLQIKAAKDAEDRARFERVNIQLLASSDEKDRILSNYREEAVTHIESLTTQNYQLNNDIEKLEEENERLSKRIEELQIELENMPAPSEPEDVTLNNIGESVFENAGSVAPSATVEVDKEARNLLSVARIKAVMSILPTSMRRTLAVNIKRYAPVALTGDRSRLDHISQSFASGMDESEEDSDDDSDDDFFSDCEDEEEVTTDGPVPTSEDLSPPAVGTIAGSDISLNAMASSKQAPLQYQFSTMSSLPSFDVIHEEEDEEGEEEEGKTPTAAPPTTHASAPVPVNNPTARERATYLAPPPSIGESLNSEVLKPSEMIKTSKSTNSKKKRKSTLRKSSKSGELGVRKISKAERRKESVRNGGKLLRKASSNDSLVRGPERTLSGGSPNSSFHDVLSDVIEDERPSSKAVQRMAYIIPPSVMRVRHTIMRKLSSLELPVESGDNTAIARRVGILDESEQENPSLDHASAAESQSKMLYEYQEGVSEMLEILAPYIKPPLSLKVVAVAMRFCVRFRRAFEKNDLMSLGAYGQKVLLKRQESRHEEILKQVSTLTKKVEGTHETKRVVNQQRNELNARIRMLDQQVEDFNRGKYAYEAEIENLRVLVLRQHIIAQWQRSVAHELVSLITVLRLRMHILVNAQFADKPPPHDQLVASENGKVPRARIMYLFRRLREVFWEVMEWNREHRQQRPILTLKIGRFESFDSFGSKIRNDVRDMHFFRKFTLKDLNMFERNWNVRSNKIEEVRGKLQSVIQSKQCPTCIDYEKAYKAANPSGNLKFGADRVTSMLNVLKPEEVEELKKTMKESMKEMLREEFVQEEEQKIASTYKTNVTKYLEKEYELHDEINELNGKVLQNEILMQAEQEEKEKLADEVEDLTMKVNDLMRQNLVLRTAVKDSYRVSQSECEELQRSKLLIDKLIAAASSKTGVDKGTQLYEDHLSLCDSEGGDGILMAGAAGNFLRRVTILGAGVNARVGKGGGAISENPDTTWLRARDMDPDMSLRKYSGYHTSPPRQREMSVPTTESGAAGQSDTQRRSTKFQQLKNIPSGELGGRPRRMLAFEGSDNPGTSTGTSYATTKDVPPITKQRAALMAAYLQAGTTYSANGSGAGRKPSMRTRPLSANMTTSSSHGRITTAHGEVKSDTQTRDRSSKLFRPESAPLVKFE